MRIRRADRDILTHLSPLIILISGLNVVDPNPLK